MTSKDARTKINSTEFSAITDSVATGKIAVIGLGCRYPDSPNPKSFWENILAKRQQFRNLPNCRLPLSEYYNPDKLHPDTTYAKKAALIDGFEFDWKSHKIPKSAYDSTDIVHWLALDTSLQALAGAGLDIKSMSKDNVGVVVGNTLTGEFTRSETMRLRWPFIRKVFAKTIREIFPKTTANFFRKKGIENLSLPEAEIDAMAAEMELLYKSVFNPVTEDTLAGGLSNTIAGRICNYCDFHGGGYTVDGACSSSLLAVITAADKLANKAMDVVLAGGVDISLDTFELIGFAKAGALTPSEMKVYDEHHNGFIPGEGCGFVVMKRLEDAERDGNKIYGVLEGWGVSSDGKGGITAPSSSGQSLALIRAYQKAAISPTQLDFIEGHGTGTVVGDVVELQGIEKAFNHFRNEPSIQTSSDNPVNDNSKDGKICGITSAKSVFGHTKAAAGIAAFLKTVIAINQRVIPPIAGTTKPLSLFNAPNFPLYPTLHGKAYKKDAILRAGVSAMGFGGINSHVILSSYQSPPDQQLSSKLTEEQLFASNQNSEIFVFSAESSEGLLEQLRAALKTSLGISNAESADFAKFLTQETESHKSSDSYKCALVANSSDDLQKLLKSADEFLKESTLTNKEIAFAKHSELPIWVGQKTEEPTIGFIFPGQGSQILNTARFLIERYVWAREILVEVDQLSQKHLGFTLKEIFLRNPEQSSNEEQLKEWINQLARPDIAQPIIVASSLIWYKFLEKLGIKCQAVAGHSLGELVALHVAGAFDQATLLELTILRGKAMASAKTKGKMASLACDEMATKKIIDGIENLQIANLNSSEQTIISGTTEAIDQAIHAANNKGIKNTILPVGNAFHSSLMNDAAKAFAKDASNILTSKNYNLRTPFFSSKTGSKIEHDLNLVEHLVKQITAEVRFIDTIQSLAKEVNYLIEVGPKNILSNLAHKITNGAIPCFPIEKRAEDYFDLNSLLADLFVRNVSINFDQLFDNRLIHSFTEPEDRQFIVNPLERPLVYLDKSEESKEGKFSEVIANVKSQVITDNSSEQKIKAVNITEIETLLLMLVARKTGFSESAISLTNRVLDDLNLDSIKSAELVGSAAKELGIGGTLDTSLYANSTLQEIADALRAASKEEDELQSRSINNWVRYFVVDERKESPTENKPQTYSDLFSGSVAVLASDNELRADLIKQLKKTSKKISEYDLEEANSKDLANLRCDHLILILPKFSFSYKDLEVARRAKTFAQLNQIDFSQIKYLSVVHYNGAVKSFFSSIHQEFPRLRIRVIDLDALIHDSSDHTTSKHSLLKILASEYGASTSFASVRYDENGQRKISHPKLVSESEFHSRKIKWHNEDLILVTAGAKGITHECAFAWAKELYSQNSKVGFILLGRSANEHHEVKQALDRFAQEGIRCYYYSCDIAESLAVKEVADLIKKNHGEITALIHGAAINNPSPFNKVTYQSALSEISPKLLGLVNLLKNLDASSLKLIGAISSIISYTGMSGNAWYALSNETLVKVLNDFNQSNPHVEVVTIGYSVWDEVGMGARLGSVDRLANLGIGAISKERGVASFLDLIQHSLKQQDYLVVSRLGHLDTWNPILPQLPEANRFLEEVIYFEPEVELVVAAHLSIENDPYLKDHNFYGSLLFPAVFGLEAMAQAVAYLLGLNKFKLPIEISDIKFQKPIVVNKDSGLTIQINAIANENGEIEVGISTEQSNFKENYFSGKFKLNNATQVKLNKAKFKKPTNSLPLNPKHDLYGAVLFQGEMFQKLEEIYELQDYNHINYQVSYSSDEKLFAGNFSNSTLLGSPLSRDALLQSVQLCVLDKVMLPTHINKICLIDKVPDKTKHGQAETIVTNVEDGKVICDIEALTPTHSELIQAYEVVQGGKLSRPGLNAEVLIHPSNYDEAEIEKQLNDYAKTNGLNVPKIALSYEDHLIKVPKSERHTKEKPIFERALKKMGYSAPGLEVTWDKSGKPLVHSSQTNIANDVSDLEAVPHVSLTHDDRICIATASNIAHGCDLEPVVERTDSEWISLIGKEREKLWTNLRKITDKDIAGTLIWSAVESVVKSRIFSQEEKVNLSLGNNDKTSKNFLFEAKSQSREILVIAFICKPLRATHNSVFSCTTEKLPTHLNLTVKGNKIPEVFSVEESKEGGEVFIIRFRTSFKEANNIDRTVYYPIFGSWMGSLREIPLKPIAMDLTNDLISGEWAAITNFSFIKTVGEIRAFDLIEGRVWVDKAYDKNNSTMDIGFVWNLINDEGKSEPVIYGFQTISWAKVIGHGLIKLAPFPKYFWDYMGQRNARNKDSYLDKIKNYPEWLNIGKVVLTIDSLPSQDNILNKLNFATFQDESNLVGNVHYSNYYNWQSRVFDQMIHLADNNFYKDRIGKFVCLDTSVNHLREAMPFDGIEVRLYLSSVYEFGLELLTEFFCTNNEVTVKLAFGHQKMVFMKRDGDQYQVSDLPHKLLSFIGSKIHFKDNLNASHLVVKSNEAKKLKDIV